MTISDRSRHELHHRLDAVLGADEAATLMEHLPPVGWADVATKRDLEHAVTTLRSNLELSIAELRSEMRVGFAELRTELHQGLAAQGGQLRTMFVGLVGLLATASGLAIALSKLL